MEETLKLILDKINSMDSKIGSMDLKISSMDSELKDVKKHVIIIENDHGTKLDALLDGYKSLYEKTSVIEDDVKEIKDNLDIHETKLQVLGNK